MKKFILVFILFLSSAVNYAFSGAARQNTISNSGMQIIVNNTGDDGSGSLREAIIFANNNAGKDTILFNIAGSGPFTILPVTPLPTITDSVVIDGFSQPGASPNLNSITDTINAVYKIEIDGTSAGTSISGLTIEASGSIIRGLVINRFDQNGIVLVNSSNTIIEGNFIGTDTTGKIALGNGRNGIKLTNCNNVIIGGIVPSARNIVSANLDDGIDADSQSMYTNQQVV